MRTVATSRQTRVAPAQRQLPGARPTPNEKVTTWKTLRKTRPHRPSTAATQTLSERVDAVERLLLELIEHTAQEVRTRRVAVIEDDGFERVVLEADGTHGEITVTARGGRNGATAAELYAHDPTEGDGATAGDRPRSRR